MRIKVLHIITRLDLGGSSENTLLTVLNLDRAKYEVDLICGPTVHPPAELLARVKKAQVHLIEVKSLRRRVNVIRDPIALFKLYHLIKKRRYIIVHTHTSKAGVLGRLAARCAGVPIIIHAPHGHIFYGYCDWLVSRLVVLLERFLAGFTDSLITLTHSGKDDHVRLGIAPPEKIVPIYSGIELERFQQFSPDAEQQKKKLKLPLDCTLVGVIARLVEVKGHRYFLEAASRVAKVLPKMKFLLIGEGPLKKKLIHQAQRLGLIEQLSFLGGCEDIRPVLAILDIVVLPSLNEGMGRVILQAQLAAKPVIATSVGGIPELIQNDLTGMLVPPKDPQRLAEAIIYLLQDPQKRHKMGKAAQGQIDSRFSAETMVEEISDLYTELLKEKAPR